MDAYPLSNSMLAYFEVNLTVFSDAFFQVSMQAVAYHTLSVCHLLAPEHLTYHVACAADRDLTIGSAGAETHLRLRRSPQV